MHTVILQGGLGNQLFQYAFGHALARETGESVRYDTTFYETNTAYTKRQLECCSFVHDDTIRFGAYHAKTIVHVVRNRILSVIDPQRKVAYYDTPSRVARVTGVHDDYYQSETYFAGCADELRTCLVLGDQFKNDTYRSFETHMCSHPQIAIVHARRGDYMNIAHIYTRIDPEYYRAALAHIPESVPIFAFSDDPAWIASVIGRPYTMVSGHGMSAHEELSLMTLGTYFVIPNSTFSWWGAWLSRVPEKIVIAPKKWFALSNWSRANRDIVPESWIRI